MNAKINKKPKDKDYLKFLSDQGYFASKVVMGDFLGILAQKGGRAILIRTAWHKKYGCSDTIDEFIKTGGKSICVTSIEDLETYLIMGVET